MEQLIKIQQKIPGLTDKCCKVPENLRFLPERVGSLCHHFLGNGVGIGTWKIGRGSMSKPSDKRWVKDPGPRTKEDAATSEFGVAAHPLIPAGVLRTARKSQQGSRGRCWCFELYLGLTCRLRLPSTTRALDVHACCHIPSHPIHIHQILLVFPPPFQSAHPSSPAHMPRSWL